MPGSPDLPNYINVLMPVPGFDAAAPRLEANHGPLPITGR